MSYIPLILAACIKKVRAPTNEWTRNNPGKIGLASKRRSGDGCNPRSLAPIRHNAGIKELYKLRAIIMQAALPGGRRRPMIRSWVSWSRHSATRRESRSRELRVSDRSIRSGLSLIRAAGLSIDGLTGYKEEERIPQRSISSSLSFSDFLFC